MELFTLLYIFYFYIMGLDCFGKYDHDDVQVVCTNRFEFRLELKKQYNNNCSQVIKSNPSCGKDVTVVYGIHPPYLYKRNGSIVGILPAMLDYALESCCYGCNRINYIGPYEGMDKFYQQISSTFVLPIQTSIKTTKYFGHDYIHMFEIKAVNFIGPQLHSLPEKNIKIIFEAVFSTWPLFATAIVMAVTAGVTIWVLDNGLNQNEFPDSFPKGPFEGFWWAVVSMTTVGYGDRSPRSVCARLFAMLWIFIGITIFSMYSATLTTSLTAAAIASSEISLSGKDFAVLNSTTIGSITTMKASAYSKGYKSISHIQKAVKNNEVDGMALDENIANYYAENMFEGENIKYQLYQRILVDGSSYGMISYDTNFTKMFKSFYESNDDQRDIMAMMGMGEHMFDNNFEKSNNSPSAFFGSHEMLSATLGTLSVLTIVLTIVGLMLKKQILRKARKEDDTDLVLVTTETNNGTVPDDKILELSDRNGNVQHELYVSSL